MKALPGKVIVRFVANVKRAVLLPERSEPLPIEAEVVNDSAGEWAEGQRVIVSRMAGEDWGDGVATVERAAVLLLRHEGKLRPVSGCVVVAIAPPDKSIIALPQETMVGVKNYGAVVLLSDGDWSFSEGDTIWFDAASAQQIKLNGINRLLVREQQIYAFAAAA
jgi:co-chaperonin GroES (HSP10)